MNKENIMAIETVLFGKLALVPSVEFLKLMKRKEALIDEAIAIKNLGRSMSASEHIEATSKLAGKIIALNRKIAATGQYVTYLDS
jgi:DNA-directed RNA polymerase subunit H (RpoH/RPB5)